MTLGYLTLTPRSRSHEVLPSTLNIMWPMHKQNLKLLLPKHHEEMHFQENTIFDLWPWPWHHVTYPQAKFEVATSKSLWGDAFTRKNIIWPLTLTLGSRSHEMSPSTLYIMWSMRLQSLKLLRPTVKEKIQLQEMWQTDRRTDIRRTDFGTKLIYPISLTKKRV